MLIARVAGDIKLVDLEMGVRDLVRDVERAYWGLQFAYRNLDATVAARNASLETWRRIHALYLSGRRGGEAEKEAQAREQYYRFEEAVQNALAGGGDSPDNVVGDRASRGVQELERQLRYLIGLPINDGCLIRPIDEPPLAKVCFDWDEVLIEALRPPAGAAPAEVGNPADRAGADRGPQLPAAAVRPHRQVSLARLGATTCSTQSVRANRRSTTPTTS